MLPDAERQDLAMEAQRDLKACVRVANVARHDLHVVHAKADTSSAVLQIQRLEVGNTNACLVGVGSKYSSSYNRPEQDRA